MDQELPTDVAPVLRARRSWRQRILLSVGVTFTTVAMLSAIVVGWGAWKLQLIDRTKVDLDQLLAGGPTNYLIVGSDSRRGGDPLDPSAPDDRQPLADTIMLLRIDPSARTAKVLSLPRDLWVTVPATGKKGRINAAYAKGPQALIDTLRFELKVPINHYVEVDFRGFQKIVTAIDGVPLWFDRAMRDRNTGLDVLHPGCITLDGRNALAFARSRHLEFYENGGFDYDGTGDLGRISRQQLFLRRVIDRAKDKGIANPLTAKRLIDVGTSSVTIDNQLSVGELLALGKRFSSFDSAALDTYTLPNTPRTTDGGAQVVELEAKAAEPILNLFRDPVTPPTTSVSSSTVAASVTSTSLVPSSQVVATVLNSSGQTGLAVKAADAMVAQGFKVDHWGNGDELNRPTEATTVVRYGRGSADAARAVAVHVEGGAAVKEDLSLSEGAVVLFLGADYTGFLTAAALSTSTSVAPSAPTSSSSTSTTSTTVPPPSKVVGMVPGDVPPGRSCG